MKFEELEEELKKSILNLEERFKTIQTGRANPKILDNIMVEYYEIMTPLKEVANIQTPDARTLVIKPFDKNALAGIEKAIYEANIGLTPNNDGETIRIVIPPLTEERRKDLEKQAKELAEEARIAIRNTRKDTLNKLKKENKAEDELKNSEKEIQNIIDKYNKLVDEKLNVKAKELLEF